MHANVGDWLYVHNHSQGQPSRRAEIIAVGADGAPPFTVRWTGNDHEAIVFPGSDAEVLTTDQLTDLDDAQWTMPSSTESSATVNSSKS